MPGNASGRGVPKAYRRGRSTRTETLPKRLMAALLVDNPVTDARDDFEERTFSGGAGGHSVGRIRETILGGGSGSEPKTCLSYRALPTQWSRLPRSPSTKACSPSNTMRVKLPENGPRRDRSPALALSRPCRVPLLRRPRCLPRYPRPDPYSRSHW